MSTPHLLHQPNAAELRQKGVKGGKDGFPEYDPSLFGEDAKPSQEEWQSFDQDSSSESGPTAAQQAELERMRQMQASMRIDANGFPEFSDDQLAAMTREQQLDRQSRLAGPMVQSDSRSTNGMASSSSDPHRAGQTNGLSQPQQASARPVPSRGPAQPQRQPPGFGGGQPTTQVNPLELFAGSKSQQVPPSQPSAGLASGMGGSYSQSDAQTQQVAGASPSYTQQQPQSQQIPNPPPAAGSIPNGYASSQASHPVPSQRPVQQPSQFPAQLNHAAATPPLNGHMQQQPQRASSRDFEQQMWIEHGGAAPRGQDWNWIHDNQIVAQQKGAQTIAYRQPGAQQGSAQQPRMQQQAGYRTGGVVDARGNAYPSQHAPQTAMQQEYNDLLQGLTGPIKALPQKPVSHEVAPPAEDGSNMDDFLLTAMLG